MAGHTAESRDDWARLASESFVPVEVAAVAHRFSGMMDRHAQRDASLTRVRSSSCEIVRTKQVIAQSAPDMVLFSVQVRGSSVVTQGGHQARLSPGDGVLYLSDHPYSLRFPTQADLAILQVPVSYLGLSRKDLSTLSARALPTQSDRALQAYTRVVRSFLEEPPTSHEVQRAVPLSIELLGHAFRQQLELPGGPRSHEALLAAFRLHIQERLDDPELDLPTLASAEGVSIRTVHGVFARIDRTPAHYIRRVRLERAQHLLELTNMPVAQIAATTGFSDATTLTRAFRREFGMPPGAYRNESRAEEHRRRSPIT